MIKTITDNIKTNNSHQYQQSKISNITCLEKEERNQNINIDICHRNQREINKNHNNIPIWFNIPMPKSRKIKQYEEEKQKYNMPQNLVLIFDQQINEKMIS